MQKLTPTKLIYRDENVNYMNTTKRTPPIKRVLNCMNHPTKRAKYCMPKDQSVSLCSKCAVSMVGKGFKVEELHGCTEDIRKDHITNFLRRVNQTLPRLEQVVVALNAKKEDIQKHYEQQKDKVLRFHQQIQSALESERERVLEQLASNFNVLSCAYDEAVIQLQTALREGISMQRDIEQNLDRIIKQITNEPFQDIMGSYNKNIEVFINKMEEVERQPVDVLRVNVNDQVFQKVQQLNDLLTIGVLKTSLIKKSLQNTTDNMYVSFENKDQFTQPRQSKNNPIRLPRTPTTKETITTSIPKVVIPTSVPIKNIDLYEDEPSYEEGHSQMIERDDIEQSYQAMLCDSSSEEDVTQLMMQQGVKLFCSPQFKDH